MTISKNATKLMAFVLTFAFVLMGLAYVPKEAQAAEATDTSEETEVPEETKVPEVRVLGATLRLGDEDGKQSLRLAIEVSNASYAKDCGIEITSRNTQNTVTVATDVDTNPTNRTKQHKEMYDIDKTADKVVYSAVITGIPSDHFGDLFEVKGYVKAVEAENTDDKIYSGTPVLKSVQGVVDVLHEVNSDIDMKDGQLVMGTRVLTADDPDFQELFKELMTPTTLMLEPSINDAPTKLEVGKRTGLTVSIKQNHNAEIQSIVWSVQGEAVIEQNGDKAEEAYVTARKEGTVKVYVAVTAYDGQQNVTRMAMAEISAEESEPLDIHPFIRGSLNGQTMDKVISGITVGNEVSLEVFADENDVNRDDVTIENVEWFVRGGAAVIEPDSTDTKKANITAVKDGKATVYASVTVKEKEGDRTATARAEASVSVNKPSEPLKINPTITLLSDDEISSSEEIPTGYVIHLDMPVTLGVDLGTGDSEVHIESVEWSIRGSRGSLSTIDGNDDNTAVFTALKSGMVTIYARVTAIRGDEKVTDTAKVEVKTQPVGFNDDGTEYTLQLNGNSLYTNNDGEFELNGDDGSATYRRVGDSEFGFQIPQKVYENYKFRGIEIEYNNATADTISFGCERCYNQNSPFDDNDRKFVSNNIDFKSGSGKILIETVDNDYIDSKKLSGIKFWSGAGITFTKVVFIVAADGYELPLTDAAVSGKTESTQFDFNEDGSVTIKRSGNDEFGFQLPEEEWANHKFRNAIIQYRDASADYWSSYTKYYNMNVAYGLVDDKDKMDSYWGNMLHIEPGSESRQIRLSLDADKDYNEEKKFTALKFWDNEEDLTITIEKIIFTDY